MKTGHAKGRSHKREGEWKKEVKEVNMVDVLSIQEWTQKTCWNHHKKGTNVERRKIEGMANSGYNTCIHGNVTIKLPI
jgi:hypothetical protein